MNEQARKHILQYLSRGLRYDGRKNNEFRNVVVEYDVSSTAEGSARVNIGETEVIAGVKLSIEKPYPDTPDNGSLMVGAELLPLSNPEFELGPPGIQAVELARVVDRGIRESKAIDTKKLCVAAGEKVWIVMIDICTINDAGNLFDASSLAAMAALQSATFPAYDGTAIDYRTKTDEKLPLKYLPISVTVLKIGQNFIVDPSPEEESVADARLTVASTEEGTLCAMQKGGEEALTIDEINKMIDIAVENSQKLRSYLRG